MLLASCTGNKKNDSYNFSDNVNNESVSENSVCDTVGDYGGHVRVKENLPYYEITSKVLNEQIIEFIKFDSKTYRRRQPHYTFVVIYRRSDSQIGYEAHIYSSTTGSTFIDDQMVPCNVDGFFVGLQSHDVLKLSKEEKWKYILDDFIDEYEELHATPGLVIVETVDGRWELTIQVKLHSFGL